MRRASKVDDNQVKIVHAFRKLGYTVHHCHGLGQGFPDIIICAPDGTMELIEIKDGAKVPSAQKLTDQEERFHNNWPRKVYIINSIEAVLQLHKDITNEKEISRTTD